MLGHERLRLRRPLYVPYMSLICPYMSLICPYRLTEVLHVFKKEFPERLEKSAEEHE